MIELTLNFIKPELQIVSFHYICPKYMYIKYLSPS